MYRATAKLKRMDICHSSIQLLTQATSLSSTSGDKATLTLLANTHITATASNVERRVSVRIQHCFTVLQPLIVIRLGWRLDSWILSKRIADKVKMCEIRHEWWVSTSSWKGSQKGMLTLRIDSYGASDHVPVVMDFEGDL